FPIGVTTNTFVVTDASGNTATCSFDVTVNDTQLPTITCNAPITVSNDNNVCGAAVTYTVSSADNCAGQTVAQTAGLASGSVFPIGVTTNTFVVTDASGNTATCSFDVTVNDTQLPTITCNAPITVSNDNNVCGAAVTYTVTSADNCAGQTVAQTAGLASGSVFPIGVTTNTFVVTDASGNTAACSFTVTVNDTQLPTITCNAPITVSNDNNVCGATVTYTVTSADNCAGQTVAQTAGLASGSVFPIGVTTNTFVVTDASGNTATCSFDVTVNDTQLPTITCNAPIVVSNDVDVCGATVTYTVTSADNCAGQTVAQTAGLASGSVFPIGVTTNTFVVTDASGNTATC
ncbi:HYR domain-containing protein, partial [Flavobacterium gillisiae]